MRNKKFGYVFPDIHLEGKRRGFIEKEFNFFEQLFLNQIPYCIFISKENFLNYGKYDENMKLGYEDWDLNIRLGTNKIFGKNFIATFFDKTFLITNENSFNLSTASFESLPPSGKTNAFAVFKSGLILTSVTVISFVCKLGSLASSLIKIMLNACLTISPTLNCR